MGEVLGTIAQVFRCCSVEEKAHKDRRFHWTLTLNMRAIVELYPFSLHRPCFSWPLTVDKRCIHHVSPLSNRLNVDVDVDVDVILYVCLTACPAWNLEETPGVLSGVDYNDFTPGGGNTSDSQRKAKQKRACFYDTV